MAADGEVLATGRRVRRVVPPGARLRRRLTGGDVLASRCTEIPARLLPEEQAVRRRIRAAGGAVSRARSLAGALRRGATLQAAASRCGSARLSSNSGRVTPRLVPAVDAALPVSAADTRTAVAAGIPAEAATAAAVDMAGAAEAIAKRSAIQIHDFFPRARTSTSQRVRAFFLVLEIDVLVRKEILADSSPQLILDDVASVPYPS